MSFNQTNLRKTKTLARELIQLVELVQEEIAEQDKEYQKRFNEPRDGRCQLTANPSRTTGELRRKSMDLTRALANLRRS